MFNLYIKQKICLRKCE